MQKLADISAFESLYTENRSVNHGAGRGLVRKMMPQAYTRGYIEANCRKGPVARGFGRDDLVGELQEADNTNWDFSTARDMSGYKESSCGKPSTGDWNGTEGSSIYDRIISLFGSDEENKAFERHLAATRSQYDTPNKRRAYASFLLKKYRDTLARFADDDRMQQAYSTGHADGKGDRERFRQVVAGLYK